MSLHRTSRLALLSVASLGCFLYPDRDSGTIAAVIDASESADVFGHYRVSFSGVQNDSRCPLGAACTTLGDATVHFTVVNQKFIHPGNRGLTLHTSVEPRSGTSESVTIRVDSLFPWPRAGQTIQPSEYRVYVTLTR
jgi:hypothetical protein